MALHWMLMFERYSRFIYRFQWWLLGIALAIMAGAAVYAAGVFGSLSQGGFDIPGAESTTVNRLVNEQFGGNRDSLVLLLSSPKLTVDDPAFQQATQVLIDRISPDPEVNGVTSYYDTGSSRFVSRDRHATYVLVGLKGSSDNQATAVGVLRPYLTSPVLKVQLGGNATVGAESTRYVKQDLERADLITFPVTAVLLVALFGSVVAASLPLAVGLFGIIGALVITRLVTYATDISVYVLDIVSLLGLGLAIDYSLFMVNRFREEMLQHDGDCERALARTLASAGRTVMFSGLTVLIALSGLIIFPIGFLRSMGIGGAAAVLVAMAGALFFLPVILAVLGNKVDALRLIRILPLSSHNASRRGIWWRICQSVMKRPVLVAVGTLSLIILAGTPFLGIHFVNPDYHILPPGSQSYQVGQAISQNFALGNQSPVEVVAEVPPTPAGNAQLASYVQKLRNLPGVVGVETSASNNYRLIDVIPKTDAFNLKTKDLVATIRSVPSPGITRWVGGQTAELVDLLAAIRHYGIYALIVILTAMLLLFFLMLGSIVIPLKTIILNILSLSASFGALVWIFQGGHLSGLVGTPALEGLDATQPVIIFALAFGLSMDYAIFLFSRVKERFDEDADIEKAISWGVQKTGGIITSAAVLLLVVIAAFAAGRIVVMKEVGIGLIVAVLVDVFIVRLLLVPASMRLLGKYNWWAPKPLAKLYQRFGFRESL